METQQSSLIGIEYYWLILKRRWVPATAVFLSIFLLGAIATTMKKQVYEAEGKLRFKKFAPISSLTEVGKEIGSLDKLAEKSNPLTTEAEVVVSVPVVKEVLTKLKLKNERGEPLKAKDFLSHLMVSDVKGTDVLKVSFKHSDPKIATDTVNTLMNVYLHKNIEINREEAVAARKFIEQQLPKAEANTHRAEVAMRQFKEENQIVALDRESADLVTQINELQRKINDYKSQIADGRSQIQLLKSKLGMDSDKAMLIVALSQSPEIQEVVQKLQAVESSLAAERSRYTENNPALVNLQQEVKTLKVLLDRRVNKVIGTKQQQLYENFQVGELQQQITRQLISIEAQNIGLSNQINQLINAQNEYRQRASKMPQLVQKFQELERKQNASQVSYSLLLKQLQEIRVAENQNIGNVRIISAAVNPDEPIASRQVAYLASIVFALFAAYGAAYLLEISDKSIKTVEEARKIFGYTWLGIIPSLTKPKKFLEREEQIESAIPQLVVRDIPASPISESYRMLQSNLKFISSDRKLKVIVVTSSVSGEGKSKVSANLATAMAQVGNRVLLVDANLHHPTQHKIWDLYNNLGLSNLIAEKTDSHMAIEPVAINLDVLTSGTIPPSPTTLLDSQRMSESIEHFAARYDFVIIDTPSLNFAADAPILGRMADGVILVVKPGLVDAGKAIFAKEILERSGQNVLGIVINGVMPDKEPHSYYYHSLESKREQSASTLGLPAQPQEELWETVSRLAKESKKTQFNPGLNLDDLTDTPLDNLQETIEQLQTELNKLALLVDEQEEELNYQRQTVKQMQQQLTFAELDTRDELEEQLLQEQEKNRMLYKTLVGQRRNLEKRRDNLRQYQEILQSRQRETFSN
jgi:polysaccharide biosynthesis transport protein